MIRHGRREKEASLHLTVKRCFTCYFTRSTDTNGDAAATRLKRYHAVESRSEESQEQIVPTRPSVRK